MRHVAPVMYLALFSMLAVVLTSAPARAQNLGDYYQIEEDPFGAKAGDKSITLSDPIRGWNRIMFDFNDRVYFVALKPAARGYKRVTSSDIRDAVRNFFRNVAEVRNFVNALLQGESRDAVTTVERFVVNTTVGFAGLRDVAKDRYARTDYKFDQTLSRWGIRPGPYVVWPFLGPSTARGTVGWAGDEAIDPANYVGDDAWVGGAASLLDTVNETTYRLGTYEDVKRASVDPYIAIKDIYEKQISKYKK